MALVVGGLNEEKIIAKCLPLMRLRLTIVKVRKISCVVVDGKFHPAGKQSGYLS